MREQFAACPSTLMKEFQKPEEFVSNIMEQFVKSVILILKRLMAKLEKDLSTFIISNKFQKLPRHTKLIPSMIYYRFAQIATQSSIKENHLIQWKR